MYRLLVRLSFRWPGSTMNYKSIKKPIKRNKTNFQCAPNDFSKTALFPKTAHENSAVFENSARKPHSFGFPGTKNLRFIFYNDFKFVVDALVARMGKQSARRGCTGAS